MSMSTSRKGKAVINRAISLYNERINGKRIYTVAIIREILKNEFDVTVHRSTIYVWLDRYNKFNKLKKEDKKNG